MGPRVYVAGHTGLLGSALLRRLEADGYTEVITRTHAELDLTDAPAVRVFFEDQRPEYVLLAAARVGGIGANDRYRAEFIHTNLAIQTSVIDTAYRSGVERLVFFGSNCAYPKDCPQPMMEDYLLSGYLESTSQPYAIAKIAGMAMCEAYNRQYGTCFISLLPPTLYGPRDNFDARSSHALSGLITRIDEAKETNSETVAVWGSGAQRREFLYVDDLADACLLLMNLGDEALRAAFGNTGWVLNVGSGEDLAIMELASVVQQVVGFEGRVVPDTSYPDGADRKLLDSRRFRRLGWTPETSLREGIERTYDWFLGSRTKAAHGLR